MPRNFNNRVELLFPIESERLREQIRREVVEPALRADVRAYELQSDGSYRRLPDDGSYGTSLQALVLELSAHDPSRRPLGLSRPPAPPNVRAQN
jgi:polyphosphate kinase